MDYENTLKYRIQEYKDFGKLKINLKDINRAIKRDDLREILDGIEHWILISITDKFGPIAWQEIHIKKQWFTDFLDRKDEGIVYINCSDKKYRIIFKTKEKWYSKKQYIEITLEYLNSKVILK